MLSWRRSLPGDGGEHLMGLVWRQGAVLDGRAPSAARRPIRQGSTPRARDGRREPLGAAGTELEVERRLRQLELEHRAAEQVDAGVERLAGRAGERRLGDLALLGGRLRRRELLVEVEDRAARRLPATARGASGRGSSAPSMIHERLLLRAVEVRLDHRRPPFAVDRRDERLRRVHVLRARTTPSCGRRRRPTA